MKGFEEFSTLIENDLGILKDVEQRRSQNKFFGKDILNCTDLEIIILIFENATIVLRAIGEDDTLEIATKIPSEFDRSIKKSLSNLKPWQDAIGEFLFSAWYLTNDRGYSDAIQF